MTFVVFALYTKWQFIELLLVLSISIFFFWSLQHQRRLRLRYKCKNGFPGPFSLPLLGCGYLVIFNGLDLIFTIIEILRQYPDVVQFRLGTSKFYSTSRLDHLEIIFNNPKTLTRPKLYQKFDPTEAENLFTASGPTWKRLRRIVLPAYSQKILEQFVESFTENGLLLLEEMKKYSGKEEFDINNIIAKYSLDIFCETALGVKARDEDVNTNYRYCIDRLFDIAMKRLSSVWYSFDIIFNLSALKTEQNELIEKISNFTYKVLKEKQVKKNASVKDGFTQSIDADAADGAMVSRNKNAFLDHLVESHLQGENISMKEIFEAVYAFMVAGYHTTASTESIICVLLGIYQDVQQKVYEEVIEVVGYDRPIHHNDLNKLNYTEQVIKETLRLFPIAGILARAVEDDLSLGDLAFPKGATVLISVLNIHRNEKYWPDPLKFNPDRFSPEENLGRNPYSFLAFSAGPRNCIGNKFGMMSMKVMLATVVRKFKFFSSSYHSAEDIKLWVKLVVFPQDGYKVRFEPRCN